VKKATTKAKTSLRPPPLIPGIRPDAAWWRQLHPAYWGLPFLAFAAILASPPDVLERIPVLQAFCNQMITWFPFLGKHAARSSIPQLTTAVMCVSFALLPIASIIPFVFLWHERGKVLQDRLNSGERPPKTMEIIGLFIYGMTYAGYWLPGDPSWCRGCGTASVFGIATLTAGALAMAHFAPMAVLSCIYIRLGFWLGTTK
jgi:hypothetical protein